MASSEVVLNEYISSKYLPEDIRFNNPSHMSKSDVARILFHWRKRQAAGKVPLKFRRVLIHGNLCPPRYPSGMARPEAENVDECAPPPSPPRGRRPRMSRAEKDAALTHLVDLSFSGEETDLPTRAPAGQVSKKAQKSKRKSRKQPTTPPKANRQQVNQHVPRANDSDGQPIQMTGGPAIQTEEHSDPEAIRASDELGQNPRRVARRTLSSRQSRHIVQDSDSAGTDANDSSPEQFDKPGPPSSENNSSRSNNHALSLTDEPSHTERTWKKGKFPTTRQLVNTMFEQDRRYELRRAKWRKLQEEGHTEIPHPRRSPPLETRYIQKDGTVGQNLVRVTTHGEAPGRVTPEEHSTPAAMDPSEQAGVHHTPRRPRRTEDSFLDNPAPGKRQPKASAKARGEAATFK